MTGAGSVSLREIGRVKSAATRVALLPVVDLARLTPSLCHAIGLARAAANLEVAAARARLHATRPEPLGRMADRDPQPRQGAPIAG